MSDPLYDYKEAAYHLRVSVEFLRYCTERVLKPGGRVLQEEEPGHFRRSELDAFTEHLWEEWETRSIPDEVTRELNRETQGRCAYCDRTTERLKRAHIDRKDVERKKPPRKGYCQHPHNLVYLCGECHDRYDLPPEKAPVDNAAIKAAKERRLAHLMTVVDREVEQRRMLREVADEIRADAQKSYGAMPFMQAAPTQQLVEALTATTGSFGADVSMVDLSDGAEALMVLSGSLGFTAPLVSAQLRAYAHEIETGEESEEGDEWRFVEIPPEPGMCATHDGNCACIESCTCLDCGEVGYTIEEPSSVEEDENGLLIPHFEDARGDTAPLACEKCGSSKLEVEFEEHCSYCKDRWARLDDE